MEPDADGNRYIIALIDSFTRFLVMKPVKDTSAATAARFLFEVTGIFEMPRSILTGGYRVHMAPRHGL